jgi:hypothetical protein
VAALGVGRGAGPEQAPGSEEGPPPKGRLSPAGDLARETQEHQYPVECWATIRTAG